jgi:hypothetical protein
VNGVNCKISAKLGPDSDSSLFAVTVQPANLLLCLSGFARVP